MAQHRFPHEYFYDTGLSFTSPASFPIVERYTVLNAHEYNEHTLLNQETKECLENMGLEILFSRTFISPPNTVGQFHADYVYPGHEPSGSLNFVVDSYKDWTMKWYDYPDDAPRHPRYSKWGIDPDNVSKVTRTDLELEYGTELASHSFGDACLVRIDVPHFVVNYGPAPRVCVTIRFKENNYFKLLDVFRRHLERY